MTRPTARPGRKPDELGARRGCVAATGGWLALTILAPVVAAVRGWQAWRRGPNWIVRVQTAPANPPGSCRIEVEADIPLRAGSGFPTRLTDAVVRVAEALRRPDDVYHHVARVPGAVGAVLQPVGPQPQELGERLSLTLGRTELEGRTVVWLTLPADRPVAELAGLGTCDPETAGEPDGLIDRSRARWAMTSVRRRIGPSTRYHVVLWVPEDREDAVRAVVERLEGGP